MTVNGKPIATFDYLYFFYMVILMAYLTPETRVFNGGFVSRPIAFAIPLVLTIIMSTKHGVSFSNRKFFALISGFVIWSIIQIVSKDEYDAKSISLYVAIVYVFFSSYIHVNVYKEQLFELYEHFMVLICKITFPLWVISNLASSTFASFFLNLPKTGYGNHLLYLYNWMNPALGQVEGSLLRNAGCSWEPGRFGIMICLAIMINLSYNGLTFKGNKKLIWLLLALLSTLSTTAYLALFVIFVMFYLKRIDIGKIIGFFIIAVIGFYATSNIRFLGDKLSEHLNLEIMVENIENSWQWTEENFAGERAYAMDRLPSAYYEWVNFKHDPVLGYGCDRDKCYFYQNYTKSIDFTGGLVTNFAKYGLVLGFFFYLCLWKSSKKICLTLDQPHPYILFVLYLLMLFSYPLMEFAIFSAIWFYDLMLNVNYEY